MRSWINNELEEDKFIHFASLWFQFMKWHFYELKQEAIQNVNITFCNIFILVIVSFIRYYLNFVFLSVKLNVLCIENIIYTGTYL